MARSKALQNTTTASRLLAIVNFVRRTEGEESMRELIAELGILPELLDDETRPIPLSTFHAALLWLGARRPKALLAISEDIVASQGLAVFVELVQNSRNLLEALDKLSAAHPGWQILSLSPGRLRIKLEAASSRELADLLQLFHAAELSALPLLFGLPLGKTRLLPGDEILLEWREPDAFRGNLIAVVLASVVLLVFWSSPFVWQFVAGSFGVASLVALIALREERTRVEARAKEMRIRILERGLAVQRLRVQSAEALTEGAILDETYLLGERLGAGASGVIHRAARLDDRSPCAIKLLRATVLDDPVAMDRLQREAEALSLSRHPHVVELLAHASLPDGRAFLVLEQLEGESLASRLEREGSLSSAELSPIALEICDALTAIHAAGVVHRDIKPSNIFLANDGRGRASVKVIDFGIAQVEWAETRLSKLGPLGTPGYMSPEQTLGRRVCARSDIYSLGILLRECLLGASAPSLAERRDSGVTRIGQAIEAGWEEIIERATADKPEKRFADARELRRAIASVGERARAKTNAALPGFEPG